MSKFKFGLLFIVGAVVGVAAFLAHRISRETGKSLVEAAAEVPAEAERYLEEIRVRGTEALEAGMEAARDKQAEVEERLRGNDDLHSQGPSA